MAYKIITYMGQAYGCSTYSNSAAYGQCPSTSTGGTSGGSSGGLLANTGYDVLIPIILGISLIIAGAILLIRRAVRRAKQRRNEPTQPTQPTPTL